MNTPRAIYDANQNLKWKWDQAEPFGVNAPDENPAGQGTFVFDLRFPGQYFYRESGLHYNYWRDYDSSLARYVESDQIGLAGGIHTYAYVDSNSLTWFDPDGAAKKYQKPANPNRRKGAENRQPTGDRERNVKHPKGEEHSRRPKGGFRMRICIPLTIWEIWQAYCEENPGAMECMVPPDPDDPCKGDPYCA